MALAAACALALAACGGGGGDSPVVNPPVGENPSGVTEIKGLTQQAVDNGVYEVNASVPGTVVVTLPQTPAVGSTVKITGKSTNAWTVAQNAGQFVATTNLGGNVVPGAVWNPVGPTDQWWYADASANGNVLVAMSNAALGGNGFVSVSRDRGATWTTGTTPGNWSSADMTPDGQTIVATAVSAPLSISNDAGVTWRTAETARFWLSVHVAADGLHMAAVDRGGRIYTSVDGGTNWTPRASDNNWEAIAGSQSGQRLVAIASGDSIYVSNDYGVTWNAVAGTVNADWYRVAASADGTRMVAAATGDGAYLSIDSGANWTRIYPAAPINQVAMSEDGMTIALAVPGDEVQLSTDGGATFNPVAGTGTWRAVTLSGDGNVMLAGNNAAGSALQLSTGNRTAVGILGSITGGQGDSIELEYAGDGRYNVRSSTGTFVIR